MCVCEVASVVMACVGEGIGKLPIFYILTSTPHLFYFLVFTLTSSHTETFQSLKPLREETEEEEEEEEEGSGLCVTCLSRGSLGLVS